jgi:hypothetical protein
MSGFGKHTHQPRRSHKRVQGWGQFVPSLIKKGKRMKKQKESKEEAKMSEEATLESLQTEIDLAKAELEKTKFEIEEKKKELELTSRREFTAQEKHTVQKQITISNERRTANAIIEKQKAHDKVMVKGKFMNRRAPGHPIKLPYIKYEDDPVRWHHFMDGGVYTIPRGFADQINEYYYTPNFIQKQGEQRLSNKVGENSAIHEVDTSNKKYAFVPVEFAA